MQNFRCRTEIGVILERFSYLRLVTDKEELKSCMAMARESSACDHDSRAFISAHRINRDSRPHSHRLFPSIMRQKQRG